MSDHLDSMDHAELASKTRELLEAYEAYTGRTIVGEGVANDYWSRIIRAFAALRPTPLDKLRQTLREQGWVRYEECPKGGYSLSLSLSRIGEYVETWVLPCQP